MALTRASKEQLISRYQAGLAAATHALLLDYKGIDVPQVTDLRARLRESGASYEVVKNRLARIAIKGKPLEDLIESFEGPTAVVYTNDDVVGMAKTLSEFAKTVPSLELKGGIVEGQAVAASQVAEIATLPSREELLSKLVFLLQSPITRLARTLNAVTRDFVVVMGQIEAKKAGEG
jgi:large subunit ribosomal protein L10